MCDSQICNSTDPTQAGDSCALDQWFDSSHRGPAPLHIRRFPTPNCKLTNLSPSHCPLRSLPSNPPYTASPRASETTAGRRGNCAYPSKSKSARRPGTAAPFAPPTSLIRPAPRAAHRYPLPGGRRSSRLRHHNRDCPSCTVRALAVDGHVPRLWPRMGPSWASGNEMVSTLHKP
jgi:hypothetical protein